MIQHSSRNAIETLIVDNRHATAEISLFGAQVLSFRPKRDGRERLWLSPDSHLDKTKPIRGGIPICWPWFGVVEKNPEVVGEIIVSQLILRKERRNI